MLLINKNVPAKRNETFICEKNVSTKQDPGFLKVGSMLGGRIYFKVRSSLTEALTLLGFFST